MKYLICFKVSGKSAEAAWRRFCEEVEQAGIAQPSLPVMLREVVHESMSPDGWLLDHQTLALVPASLEERIAFAHDDAPPPEAPPRTSPIYENL